MHSYSSLSRSLRPKKKKKKTGSYEQALRAEAKRLKALLNGDDAIAFTGKQRKRNQKDAVVAIHLPIKYDVSAFRWK